MMRFVSIAAMGVAVLVGGCAALETSNNTLTTAGPVSLVSTSDTQVRLFEEAYKQAFDAQLATYKDADAPTNAELRYKRMASAGFGLVKAHCSDFFRRKGESQKWLRFSSDVIGAAGALATGILALSGTSALSVSIVALSTATAYSSIDVYARNFLFGAENIDSVRVLTLNALSDNAEKALDAQVKWDFQYAANAIMTNQELCKPASILRLTREAITAGAVRSADTSGATQLDNLVRESIGLHAGIPQGSIPLDSQVAALCWAATDPAYIKTIVAQHASAKQFTQGPDTAFWAGTNQSRVASFCRKLSPASQALVQRQIEEWRSGGGATITPAATETTGSSQKTITTTIGRP